MLRYSGLSLVAGIVGLTMLASEARAEYVMCINLAEQKIYSDVFEMEGTATSSLMERVSDTWISAVRRAGVSDPNTQCQVKRTPGEFQSAHSSFGRKGYRRISVRLADFGLTNLNSPSDASSSDEQSDPSDVPAPNADNKRAGTRNTSEADTDAVPQEAEVSDNDVEYQAKKAEFDRLSREREEAIQKAAEQEAANERRLAASRARAAEAKRRYEEQKKQHEDALAERANAGANCRVVNEAATSGIFATQGEAEAAARRSIPADGRPTGSASAKWVNFTIGGSGKTDYLAGVRGYKAEVPYVREICFGNAATGREQ